VALAVLAISERGTMFNPGPALYMEKLATDAEAADAINIERPLAENLHAVAAAKGKPVQELTVVMLDRERHEEAKRIVRETGARIRLISDGDVAGALIAARAGSPIDLLYGIGGTPEGVLAAAAIQCFGGEIQGRLWPRTDEERSNIHAAGLDLTNVLCTADLVWGDNIFFAATGVTDGDLLAGVRYTRTGATTQSMVARSRSGTVRIINAEHVRAKLRNYTARIPGMAAAEPEALAAAAAAQA
jgi:fructose-1,6-bisphosphatase II